MVPDSDHRSRSVAECGVVVTDQVSSTIEEVDVSLHDGTIDVNDVPVCHSRSIAPLSIAPLRSGRRSSDMIFASLVASSLGSARSPLAPAGTVELRSSLRFLAPRGTSAVQVESAQR